MYLTMLSVILGGILNMLFVKTNFYKKYKYPIDCNRKFRDGKRIFGDNKTWIGIVSMIVCCILSQVFIGFICNAFNINNHNQIYRFYENKVGVLTNSPDFPWQVTNLNNYVNLYPGAVTPQQWGGVTIFPFGAGAGFHGIPGDVTPPSRFVRVAFYKATAPVCPTAYDAILQSFHILNNFDIPIGIEYALGKAPDIPSATQWTSAIDLTNRKVYYKTAYNNNIRCISMKKIDFDKVKYQSYPLDKELKQPVEEIIVK